MKTSDKLGIALALFWLGLIAVSLIAGIVLSIINWLKF